MSKFREIRENYESFKEKPFVQTVKGPIEPDKVGNTLMHEHSLLDYSFGRNLEEGELPISDQLWPIERILECYDRAEATGINTTIDAGPGNIPGFGLSPAATMVLASMTNLNIIKPVGFYTVDQAPMPVRYYPPAEIETLTEQLMKNLKYGFGNSGVKPGFLKFGTGPHINDIEYLWQAALVEVQKQTGMWIYVHTQETKEVELTLQAFIDNGADLSKCELGHVGWGIYDNAKERHIELLKSGINLGFDNIGMCHRPVSEYVDMVYDLIEEGYAGQILLSHDTIPVCYGWGDAWGQGPEMYHGNNTVVQTRVIPALKERGVDDDTIDTIIHKNPQRLLTLDPNKYPALKDTLLWLRPDNDVHVGGDWSGQTGHHVGIDKFFEPK